MENRAAWEGIDPAARASLLALAERHRNAAYPLLTASQYMAFARTGDRVVFEKPYFERRRKLIAALLGFCLEKTEADLSALADGVWLVCEETSWVISAHNGGEHAGVEPTPPVPLPDVEKPYVDLFAAQTAMILSLAFALAGDALDDRSPRIRQRAREEVERRVLVPFETRDDFWWMGFIRRDLCNWTPWIVSNVMLTACAWVEELPRLCAILARGCGMLDRYLDVLPDDGGCDEGPGYWSMAGGALLDCLELMERVTGGRMAFWDDAKLRNVLRFPLNAWLGGEWFANFADCDARPEIPGERLQLAGERLGDPALTAFGARFRGDPAERIADTPQLWRLLNALFHPPIAPEEAVSPPADAWLPGLEMRVLCRNGVALAIHGGVNEGSHSHNDCGSFMLYVDGDPQIVDAGNMTYSRKTFSDERYTLWNIRSRYHNVPLVGGIEQASGWERRARDVRAGDAGLSMELRDAYPSQAGVVSLRRECALAEDGVLTLRDDIALSAPCAVTEVLLLRHKPGIAGAAVNSGAISIVPEAPMEIGIEEIPVVDPRMARSFPGSLWRVTFTAPPTAEHTIRLTIAPGGDVPR